MSRTQYDGRPLAITEQEVADYVINGPHVVNPRDVANRFDVVYKTGKSRLDGLAESGVLEKRHMGGDKLAYWAPES